MVTTTSRPIRLLSIATVIAMVVGCSGPIEEKQYDVTPLPPAIERVKSILKRYTDGHPASSEITLFPGFISDMRETGDENLSIVQSVYEDLQTAPERATKIARDALKEIDAEK